MLRHPVPRCAAFLALLLLASCRTPLHERELTLDLEARAGEALDVQTTNGSIEVRRSQDARVHVRANVRARTEDRARAFALETVRAEDGTLRIRPLWPGGARRDEEGCSLDVALPEVHGVRAESSNGRIVVRGVRGPAELHTSNGAVQAYDIAGAVVARTSNGRITVERADGPLDVETSNGALRLLGVGDAIHARTSNGSVLVQGDTRCAGPLDVRSSNGAITVHAPGLRGELTLRTSNGSLSVEEDEDVSIEWRDRDELRARRGGPGAASSLRTSNGSIRVTWGGRPAEGPDENGSGATPERRSF